MTREEFVEKASRGRFRGYDQSTEWLADALELAGLAPWAKPEEAEAETIEPVSESVRWCSEWHEVEHAPDGRATAFGCTRAKGHTGSHHNHFAPATWSDAPQHAPATAPITREPVEWSEAETKRLRDAFDQWKDGWVAVAQEAARIEAEHVAALRAENERLKRERLDFRLQEECDTYRRDLAAARAALATVPKEPTP